jgi:hypothetical protein
VPSWAQPPSSVTSSWGHTQPHQQLQQPEERQQQQQQLASRLASLPIPTLCPRGFVMIWVNKEHLSGACAHACACDRPRLRSRTAGSALTAAPNTRSLPAPPPPPPPPHTRAHAHMHAHAAVFKQMTAWGFSYVENLTWVLRHPSHKPLALPYPYIRRSHITLYIFRKDGASLSCVCMCVCVCVCVCVRACARARMHGARESVAPCSTAARGIGGWMVADTVSSHAMHACRRGPRH